MISPNRPNCPNCQERMSMAELGLDGVWSCIYCEGTWLSAPEVRALLSKASISGATPQALPASVGMLGSLVCPACETASLARVEVGNYKAHCCTSCQSIFFGKGVLLSLCPTIGAGASGPEVAGKAFANTVGWLILSIVSFSAS
jgi:Zn-finger nucleic acid-binding protein